uniref:ShKT domain-containing protein n=1 Tax=Steinernema glaseri TaxID=37863 RepID=A0A1I8AD20_9BILA
TEGSSTTTSEDVSSSEATESSSTVQSTTVSDESGNESSPLIEASSTRTPEDGSTSAAFSTASEATGTTATPIEQASSSTIHLATSTASGTTAAPGSTLMSSTSSLLTRETTILSTTVQSTTVSDESGTSESPTSCCPANGVWSEWVQASQCSDTCGSCGQFKKERVCISEEYGCPCTGKKAKLERCNTFTCLHPRAACCPPFDIMPINGIISCGPLPNATEPAPKPQKCCPKEGIWSAWTEWSHCVGECNQCGTSTRRRSCVATELNCPCKGVDSEEKSCNVVGIWASWGEPSPCGDTCGSCAFSTRKRQCSKANNCKCIGHDSLTEYCGIETCRHPRQACCAPFNITNINGLIGCGPLPPMPTFPPVEDCNATPKPVCCKVGGVWGPWSAMSTCPDTCGSCAKATRTRVCMSLSENNCPCSGPSTREDYCGLEVCRYPRKSCCEYFKPMILDGKIACGPLPEQFDPAPSDECMPSCCPKFGIWSEWSAPSSCNDTCGSCAQTVQRRYCLSDGNGCPCVGDDTKRQNCAIEVCRYPRTSCCGSLKPMMGDGKIVCGPQPKLIDSPATMECSDKCCPQYGVWSEWTVIKPCMDVCGSCSKETRTRTCLSEADGCPCRHVLPQNPQNIFIPYLAVQAAS